MPLKSSTQTDQDARYLETNVRWQSANVTLRQASHQATILSRNNDAREEYLTNQTSDGDTEKTKGKDLKCGMLINISYTP